MNASFRAPWGRTLLASSAMITVFLFAMGALAWLQLPPEDAGLRLAAALAPLLALLGLVLFVIRGYRLEPGYLVVERLLWRNRLPLVGLRGAQADPQAMDDSSQILGNGGAFVFAGLLQNKRLGRYRAFATDPARAVVLRLATETVVVTPDDPAAFVRALTAR